MQEIATGWLSPKTAADYAGVSRRTIDRWLSEGMEYRRAGSKLIRIKPEWVDAYVNKLHDENNATHDIDTIYRGAI